MIEKRSWFERPLAALCALSGIVFLSVYLILNSGDPRENRGESSYKITLRHYGSDAHEMETDAAVPLEDALSAITGISRIVTVSENGLVRAYADFRRDRRMFMSTENDYYDAVREAAQKVYETLPSSAQRPEISSSGDFRIPFWTAAVYVSDTADGSSSAGNGTMPAGAFLERTIKPVLCGIEGAGEVEIAGPGLREIIITVNQEKSAALGLSPADISRVLGANDGLFSGGTLRYKGLDIPLRVDGRHAQLEDLGEALIPLDSGGTVRLKAVADISEEEREAETFSRLNGKRTALISVTAASGADPGILSRKIKKEMKKFSSLPLEFRVLEDRGAEESAAFRSVFFAALEASFAVALASFFLKGRRSSGKKDKEGFGLRSGIICAAAIPLISIMSAALLSLAGFPVNRKFLAGLAVGIGGAADAVILSAEGFGLAKNPREGNTILRNIWPPLLSGAATTTAALFPLMEMGGGDITLIAGALGTVTLVSLVLALTLLPPLFLWQKSPESRNIRCFTPAAFSGFVPFLPLLKNFRRRLFRVFTRLIRISIKRAFLFPVFSLVIVLAAVLALVLAGTDTAGEWAEDSVYVQIEFEGGFLKQEGDILFASWALELKKHPAVRDVQTGARTGSGYGLVTFDPRKAGTAEIRELIRSWTIPGAFIYIPEPSPGDRIWNITVSGDDAEKCRLIATNASSLCSALDSVKETVLNFKQGGPRLTLIPRRELLAREGISFLSPADTVRRGLHGPVAYKRKGGGETDVRIRFGPSAIPGKESGFADLPNAAPRVYEAVFPASAAGIALNEKDVLRIPLVSNREEPGGLYIGSLMEAVRTNEASSIRRENRRRVASFSIRTAPGDPRLFRDKVTGVLKDLELPEGYRIEFDPEAVREAEAFSGKFFNFIWAVLFCFMIIAAAEESFVLPLVILSSVFPSLAIPVLFLCLSGTSVNTVSACALVAVSGMTVNASVLSAGALRRGLDAMRFPAEKTGAVYRALRSRIPALVATSGTTLAGALPFLFLREGSNALIRILSLVTVLGVGTSFFCSITLVPSLMIFFRGSRRAKAGKSCSAPPEQFQ